MNYWVPSNSVWELFICIYLQSFLITLGSSIIFIYLFIHLFFIANHFNTFFTSVASKLVDALPTAKGTYSVMSMCFRNFYSQRNVSRNQLVLQEVSEQFIYEELCGLNVTKSTGLDEISAKFLKLGASVIKVPVTSIINQSIRSGIVPNSMKQARVKPLFKKGSPLQVGNYRPVSILSVVSKILEKSIYCQLKEFLQYNNMLYVWVSIRF